MMVEGTPILRQSSTNEFLVWSLKCFHVKVVNFIVEFEQKDYSTANMDVRVFPLKLHNKINHLQMEKLQ
jgi:hypothetical protein